MESFRKFRFAVKVGIYVFFTLLAANCSIHEEFEDALLLNEYDMVRYSNDLSFMVISDWGFNGSQNQMRVAYQMAQNAEKTDAAFILTCGDNFQVAGVKSIIDPQWGTNFEDIYTDSALMIPWYPALGNHDYYGDPDAQVTYESVHGNWNMEGRYYTFVKTADSSQIRFIILDTQDLIADYGDLDHISRFDNITQYRWFKTVLSQATEQWIIVVGHHPIISAGTYHGSTKELDVMIKPLLEKYQVDFYLSGHDHHFEHSNERPGGTDYIVTGTGGESRPVGYAMQTVYAVSEVGFTQMSVTRNDIVLQFINYNGKEEYQYRRSN